MTGVPPNCSLDVCVLTYAFDVCFNAWIGLNMDLKWLGVLKKHRGGKYSNSKTANINRAEMKIGCQSAKASSFPKMAS